MFRLLSWRGLLLIVAVAMAATLYFASGTDARERWRSASAAGGGLVAERPRLDAGVGTSGQRVRPAESADGGVVGDLPRQDRPANAFDPGYLLATRTGTAVTALRLLRSDERVPLPAKRYFDAALAETCRGVVPAALANPNPLTQRDLAHNRRAERSDEAFCAGMPALGETDLGELWRAAANAGDPRAIALQAWRTEFGEGPLAGVPGSQSRAASTLSDARTQRLLDAMGTRDPSAIVYFGQVLSQTTDSHYLRLDNGVAISDLPDGSWTLMACEYGLDCSREGRMLSGLCARDNSCDFANFEAYLRGSAWTPDQAARFDHSRDALRALIESGSARGLRVESFADAGSAPRYYIVLTPLRLAR